MADEERLESRFLQAIPDLAQPQPTGIAGFGRLHAPGRRCAARALIPSK